ncbi:hypothetical protein ACFPT7_24875 [Acidicapsa dinghuensis]|uniref:Uncharacterized protein n=1 Tax=Acidicapsa dinghuensis TaxID=2218256 RepID=A0ABW1ENE1_9BACT|nr:hypothetical protein [Acidicapsa dinghuensis]
MKLAACLFLSAAALAQQPNSAKTITFNRADTEHCRVVAVSGKPLLESTFNGTSVAVGLPVNRGNGDFAVFVAVDRVAGKPVQVNPKDFYGLYSDPDHTRFDFYDQSAEMAGPGSGMNASSAQIDPGSIRPGAAMQGGPPPGSGSIESEPPPGAQGSTLPAIYFRHGKIKQGEKIVGWVILRQPKGSKLTIAPTDMLAEINIIVDGTVFRF